VHHSVSGRNRRGLTGLVDRTRKRFGDESGVQTMYLIVEPGTDPTTPEALSLSVYVSSDYGGGSVVFADDEAPKRLDLPT